MQRDGVSDSGYGRPQNSIPIPCEAVTQVTSKDRRRVSRLRHSWVQAICIAATFIFAPQALAESQISGSVEAKDSGAVPNAQVWCRAEDGNDWEIVATDEKGYYVCDVEPGNYSVEVLGQYGPMERLDELLFLATDLMNTQRQYVKVFDEEITGIDFSLEPTRITGHVIDQETSKPLQATITVHPSARESIYYIKEPVKTDEKGNFTLEFLTGRKVWLDVSARSGLKIGGVQVEIPPNRDVEIPVTAPCDRSSNQRAVVGFKSGFPREEADAIIEDYGGKVDELVTDELYREDTGHEPMLAADDLGGWRCHAPHRLEAEHPEAVRYVERDPKFDVEPAGKPAAPSDWHTTKIDAPKVWDRGITGGGVKVCIDDSGVHRHSFLENRVAKGHSFIKGQSPYSDVIGHGTAMAGLVAAKRSPGLNLGVAPRATVVPVKIADDDGTADFSAVVAAWDWSARQGRCKIINYSMTFADESFQKQRVELQNDAAKTLRRVVEEKKIVLVAGAGNDNTASQTWPCSTGLTICVGATDRRDFRMVFTHTEGSNYGWRDLRYPYKNYWVDVAAPGAEVTSLSPPDGSADASGTSRSTAIVSGAAALIVQKHGADITPAKVKDRLKKSGVKVKSEPVGRIQPYIGYRPNAFDAVFGR